MKILVLVQGYPSEQEKYNMSFVHTRILAYRKKNLEVTVVSFSAPASYIYENVQVLSYNDYLKENIFYDLIISHAPNIRNHLRFFLRHHKGYGKALLFIHGHEVMVTSKYYPSAIKEYAYVYKNKRVIVELLIRFYDEIKVKILSYFINSLINKNKIHIVFVSLWMKKVFLENVKIEKKNIDKISYIIHNPVHDAFIMHTYEQSAELYGDFITIRPLDNPKYGIDLVVKIAKLYSEYTFHIYGKGDYDLHNNIPGNIKIFKYFLNQEQIKDMLNHYRCALMPTRLDAQGVMMCEMATFGIPLITSDLSICREMLEGYNNVYFFNNDNIKIDLHEIDKNLNNFVYENVKTKDKFSYRHTMMKEIKLIKHLCNDYVKTP